MSRFTRVTATLIIVVLAAGVCFWLADGGAPDPLVTPFGRASAPGTVEAHRATGAAPLLTIESEPAVGPALGRLVLHFRGREDDPVRGIRVGLVTEEADELARRAAVQDLAEDGELPAIYRSEVIDGGAPVIAIRTSDEHGRIEWELAAGSYRWSVLSHHDVTVTPPHEWIDDPPGVTPVQDARGGVGVSVSPEFFRLRVPPHTSGLVAIQAGSSREIVAPVRSGCVVRAALPALPDELAWYGIEAVYKEKSRTLSSIRAAAADIELDERGRFEIAGLEARDYVLLASWIRGDTLYHFGAPIALREDGEEVDLGLLGPLVSTGVTLRVAMPEDTMLKDGISLNISRHGGMTFTELVRGDITRVILEPNRDYQVVGLLPGPYGASIFPRAPRGYVGTGGPFRVPQAEPFIITLKKE